MEEISTSKRQRVTNVEDMLKERKGLVDLLSIEENLELRDLLDCAFSMSFKNHRDAYFDQLALVDCAIEIVQCGTDKAKCALQMCHKIQMSLSNEELRLGWRVSFACKGKSHRFYYLNDHIRARRVISFRCRVKTL